MTDQIRLREEPLELESGFSTELIGTEWESEVNRSNRDYLKWVQQSLNQILGLRLTVDGDLGFQTRSAIRSFQKRQGLPVDGIVGPPTEAALTMASGNQPPAASAEFEAFDTERVDQEQHELVRGSCPDVPVPPSRRPRVLVLDSIHSAVREAQRKLNAFHAYRLAAGLPGLRDTPLVEDCNFGKHTFQAVKSFQELVFPGMPVEQDGKIGSHTWAQLDAIAVGPNQTSQVKVEQLRVMDNSFGSPLSWNQVIGLDTTTLNLELIASGLPPATMPAQIRVELSSRVPNRVGGTATLITPFKLEVPRLRPDPANPNRIVYRVSQPLASIGDFLRVERRLQEVATVVRRGGTSDGVFRSALGWNPRGIATQPIVKGASTGSEPGEIPDAFALFLSAGAEVLEIKVSVQPNWSIPGAVKRLIRNPAEVFYYSGHGLAKTGKLEIDLRNRPCPDPQHLGDYKSWLGPADLIPVWTKFMDLDVLILAGCSVLKIDFSSSPPTGPGLEWAKLLTAKGGPLLAILGYQKGAPCDNSLGDKIAKEMGQRMARGSTNYARDWLEINGDNNATNAVAMDSSGYWWIRDTWGGYSYDIEGPKPLP
jgi:peptidoglycan hydrolase-like protein with peptidoglycan-binding domain